MNIYLINRSDRRERLLHAQEQLKLQNLNAHVFPAIIDRIGWRGCMKSHLNCIVDGDLSEFMFVVFEDDVLFLENIDIAFEAMEELPRDWDLLSLGASPQEPFEQYSDHLYKMGKAWCTHAMIWNPRQGGAVDAIIQADVEYRINKFDVFLSEEVYPKYNCFLMKPLICTQADFQSDVARHSDVSTIVKNYNKYCK